MLIRSRSLIAPNVQKWETLTVSRGSIFLVVWKVVAPNRRLAAISVHYVKWPVFDLFVAGSLVVFMTPTTMSSQTIYAPNLQDADGRCEVRSLCWLLGTPVPNIGDVCHENQEGANICSIDMQAGI